LEYRSEKAEPYYQWSGKLRNYVRDNALCVIAANFDAKSRKIRCIALPIEDDDVASKRYVEQSANFERLTRQNREEDNIDSK